MGSEEEFVNVGRVTTFTNMKSHKLKAIGRKIKKRRRRRENLHDQRKPIKLKFINKLNRTHHKYNREGKKRYIYIYIALAQQT